MKSAGVFSPHLGALAHRFGLINTSPRIWASVREIISCNERCRSALSTLTMASGIDYVLLLGAPLVVASEGQEGHYNSLAWINELPCLGDVTQDLERSGVHSRGRVGVEKPLRPEGGQNRAHAQAARFA